MALLRFEVLHYVERYEKIIICDNFHRWPLWIDGSGAAAIAYPSTNA